MLHQREAALLELGIEDEGDDIDSLSLSGSLGKSWGSLGGAGLASLGARGGVGRGGPAAALGFLRPSTAPSTAARRSVLPQGAVTPQPQTLATLPDSVNTGSVSISAAASVAPKVSSRGATGGQRREIASDDDEFDF